MKKSHFSITGMSCSACSVRVEKCVSGMDGVSAASVNLIAGSMAVSFDEGVTSEEKIIARVEDIGFGASLRGDSAGIRGGNESPGGGNPNGKKN